MEEMPVSDISFENYLQEEKLMGTRCRQCGALYVPPRPICISCRGLEMEWARMSGEGKLAAFTCISIGPSFMIAEGYNRNRPYISGVVELREGARVDARIEGLDARKPESISLGLPLLVKYLHREGGKTYLAFEPA